MSKIAQCLELLAEALSIYKSIGDSQGEARALHSLGAAISQGPIGAAKVQQGAAYIRDALGIFRELGLGKMVAMELNFLAKYYLLMDKPKDGLRSAKESMTIFKELDYKKGWQAESRATVVQALVQMEETSQALKVA